VQVLACILIRMALAESFCVSCGVIALDEPTTNLDAANSLALAQALRSIVDLRQQAASAGSDRRFQLIVITHDERFATQLGTREYCGSLVRVTKDDENHSRISVEPLQ
jgi:DNA repair protein RAD50